MAAQPACPYCGGKLFPHEVSNDECGTCGGRLSLAAGWTPPVPEDERPRRLNEPLILSDRPPPEAFATVRQGIHLLRWGVALSLIFATLASVGQAAGASLGKADDPIVLAPVLLAWVFAAISALVVFLGVCFCCAIPRGCDAARKAPPVIGCLMAVVPLGLFDVGCVALWAELGRYRAAALLPAADLVFFLFAIAVVACVCCFLRLLAGLARFFSDGGLARYLTTLSGVSLLCGVVALCGGWFAAVIIVGPSSKTFGEEETAGAVAAGMSVVLTAAFAWTAWFLYLLTRLLRIMPVPGEPERPREFRAGP